MNLREWMDQECIEVKQLAGKMGVSRHTIHLWLAGKTRPLRVHRALIQKITKDTIKIGDWDETGKMDRRVSSSKKDGLQSSQRLGNDSKTKPKVKKNRR